MAIRLARQDDMPALLNLYAHLNPNDPPLAQNTAQALWQQMLTSPGLFIFLGDINGQVVTTCTLIVTPNLTRGGRPYAIIENVVTHSEFRNQGLGKAILAEAVRRAAESNCYKVVLTTGSKRESTLAFYEKAGFSRNSRSAFEIRL